MFSWSEEVSDFCSTAFGQIFSRSRSRYSPTDWPSPQYSFWTNLFAVPFAVQPNRLAKLAVQLLDKSFHGPVRGTAQQIGQARSTAFGQIFSRSRSRFPTNYKLILLDFAAQLIFSSKA